MRLDFPPGEAETLEQALVFRQFQPRLERHSPQAAAFASASHSVISERTIPRPRRVGATDTRATWSASPSTRQRRRRDERAGAEDPKAAARRDLARDRFGASRRRADEGGLVGRLWAAKAVRMSSAAHPHRRGSTGEGPSPSLFGAVGCASRISIRRM